METKNVTRGNERNAKELELSPLICKSDLGHNNRIPALKSDKSSDEFAFTLTLMGLSF